MYEAVKDAAGLLYSTHYDPNWDVMAHSFFPIITPQGLNLINIIRATKCSNEIVGSAIYLVLQELTVVLIDSKPMIIFGYKVR